MNKQVVAKFVKGFLTGGLSAVIAALGVGVSIHSLDDLKGLGILLVTAFVSGAIHALVEAMNPTITVSALE
jgi:hypothetical protein